MLAFNNFVQQTADNIFFIDAFFCLTNIEEVEQLRWFFVFSPVLRNFRQELQRHKNWFLLTPTTNVNFDSRCCFTVFVMNINKNNMDVDINLSMKILFCNLNAKTLTYLLTMLSRRNIYQPGFPSKVSEQAQEKRLLIINPNLIIIRTRCAILTAACNEDVE
ncbi:CLUMA_CG002708, isoform A [Clunio marinus]|uniref:CLUMA_CG002708, isoform A n=1 Tax=Clunio marinus TaxID=568069 RepID=A0A1J1HLE2_9DIPT|nr:CLUMA_CG002708, isoform A [Clunio marinus]